MAKQKIIFISVLYLFFCFTANAQFKVQISVTDFSNHKAGNIYLTGPFNNWNPGDSNYIFTNTENNSAVINLKNIAAGNFIYKITRGSWQTEETTGKSENIENHSLIIKSDTQINISVYGWKNDAISKSSSHTFSKNVKIINDSFYMPALKRYRRIWIYLPENYFTSKEKYPVLYMHDGQNLFDNDTAPFGEWGIDESLDTLQPIIKKFAIVVGIDNGGTKRINEYTIDDTEYGQAEGSAYLDFIVKTLKPFIDRYYRTKKAPKYTAVAGSSLGGLISTYAILKNQKVFGTAGIFSSAYWIAPNLQAQISTAIVANKESRFWFYAGQKESNTMVSDMQKIKTAIEVKYKKEYPLIIDVTGMHNERTWQKWFPVFYKWWLTN